MNTVQLLKRKFKEINSKGYIKSINNNKNSSGLTLEYQLESTGGDFNIPDFYEIEIKAIRQYRFANITLFNSGPDGKYVTPTQWLSENFGYPDKDYKNTKVFKGDVYANKNNAIGRFFTYKLKVDRNQKRIILQIYNSYGKLLNSDLYWDFDSLEEKITRKLKKIAIFEFSKKIVDNIYYYKYTTCNIYRYTNFERFLKCVENGIIYVTFNTGVNKSGPYIGKFSDHGTAFRVSKNNICKMFDRFT